jgi:hypothetical protein
VNAATEQIIGIERRFSVQASSAAFLAQHQFDFNKIFYQGIIFKFFER